MWGHALKVFRRRQGINLVVRYDSAAVGSPWEKRLIFPLGKEPPGTIDNTRCVCGFFLACEHHEEKFEESFPARVFFFFFKVEINSCAPVPLLESKDQNTMAQ